MRLSTRFLEEVSTHYHYAVCNANYEIKTELMDAYVNCFRKVLEAVPFVRWGRPTETDLENAGKAYYNSELTKWDRLKETMKANYRYSLAQSLFYSYETFMSELVKEYEEQNEARS